MNEQQLHRQITRAVEYRCAHLGTDPLLAQRVLREADRKEPVVVKKKLSFGLILAMLLILLTATAVAAVLLSGMEVIEQEAVPAARQNDGEVRPENEYSYEELQAIVRTAEENGIVLDDDSNLMRALRMGEGYYEEETIMEICRQAFGGLHYEWTVEERHWFQDMMIQIGWASENSYPLPGESDLPSEEARALAKQTILDNYGPDTPLDDPARFRSREEFIPAGENGADSWWAFDWAPATLNAPAYTVTIQGDEVIHHGAEGQFNWTDYTEQDLEDAVDSVYNYRYSGAGMSAWTYEAWHAFGEKLAGAKHSEKWDEAYDAYAASCYLLPDESDLTKKQAREIVFTDAGVKDYSNVNMMLLGKGEQHIWKITFQTSEKTGVRQALSYEVDSRTGEILRRDDLTAEKNWARYVLYETFLAHAPARAEDFTREKALALAQDALWEYLGDSTIPYLDPQYYTPDVSYAEWSSSYSIIFNTKVKEYGRASVRVKEDGTVQIWFANKPGISCDTLFERYEDLYNGDIYWEQSRWVEFSREMQQLAADPATAPTTFEAKLFAKTIYPEESTVKISRDKAMDIAYLDSNRSEINRIVLIDAEPNPIWKLRVTTEYPTTTLYEIDAMTGEILDKEYYFIQMENVDHVMKMYTLRRDYMPAALAEFGATRIAMELCAKANAEDYYTTAPDDLVSGAYRVTEEGMTVSFIAVDPRRASYVVTIGENAMSAQIETIAPKPSAGQLSEARKAVIYALYEGDERFELLEELPEMYRYAEDDDADGPAEGEMTLAEAQAHAFGLLVDAVGQETVDAFGKFAVGHRFHRFQNEGDCIRWTFFFVSPEASNEGFRVTFAIRNNELWGDGQVSDVNDMGNG